MPKSLSRLLLKEQVAFLARDRSEWGEHLGRTRTFLGRGLQTADPGRPVLILGAGSGLEVPWRLAPLYTTGWDADPWSRVRTCLRHLRWAPWIFEDLTGGFSDLEATARRAATEPWSGHRREREAAARRLAGLLTSLHPEPRALRDWIDIHKPGTILVANVMGQFGVIAQRLIETVFGGPPWESDPERIDLLAEAVEAWMRRAILAFLAVLGESGASLWLLHDRAVVFSDGTLELGPWTDAWPRQLRSDRPPIEASDALGEVDVPLLLLGNGLDLVHRERWIWPLAAGQRHLVEALALRRGV